METFRASPSTAASATCGTVFDFEDGDVLSSRMILVPAVGIATRIGNHETLTVLTDPAIIRSLIADLTAGLTYLENTRG